MQKHAPGGARNDIRSEASHKTDALTKLSYGGCEVSKVKHLYFLLNIKRCNHGTNLWIFTTLAK